MIGIIVGTCIFIAIYAGASFGIHNYVQKDLTDEQIKEEYRNLTFGLTFFAVFCMWLMWISVYMHQMNPLISPILEH